MDLHTQSAFLAFLIVSGTAVGVALRATERRLAVLYTVLAGVVGLWHLAEFLVALTGDVAFSRVRLMLACALPVVAHRFFQAFLASQTASPEPGAFTVFARRLEQVLFAGAAAGVLFVLTPPVHVGTATVVAVVYVFSALLAVLFQVHQRRSATPSRVERGRLTYLVVGGILATVFSAVGLLRELSPILPAIGKFAVVLYLYLLAQAILRHRLLDLNELFARVAVLVGLALGLGVVYAVIVVWVGDDPPLFVFNAVLVGFALMTLIEPARAQVEHRLMGWLFAERVVLMRALERLRREVPGIIDPVACAQQLLDRIYDTGRATHASVYLLGEDGTGYRRVGHRGPEPPAWLDAAALREVTASAGTGHKAILRETVERRLQESRAALPSPDDGDDPTTEPEDVVRQRALHRCLQRVHAGVLVPFISGGRVVGLLALDDERVYEAFSTNEIAALILVADLVTTVVENSKLYDRMKERDRLAALGEMAAGLAHEIRNPLGAIKAAAQYLEPESLPGDEGEFLQVIIEEVDRLNGVVTQFLDYARPLKGNFAPTDLGEVVRRTVRLLEQKDIPKEVTVVLDVDGPLPPVQADPEQLRQVLINLTLNAVQAMAGRGRLCLSTGIVGRDGAPSATPESVFVAVRDDGPGIPDAARPNLFIPFFTTKEGGTGLGLPICQRIVENHGGTIEVKSRPGEGTEFVVRLPVSTEDQGVGDPPEAEVIPLRLTS
jgi:two-component system, NtrC family, sensor histidine kinase HydH